MEQEKVMILARQQDPAVAAALTKNVAELERDFKLLEGPLSERFMNDVEAVMRKAAPEPWEVVKTEWTVHLRALDWKLTRGLGNGDAILELAEIPGESDEDHTWIGCATGAGESKFGFELIFRNALKSAADSVSRDKTQAAVLEKIGFKRDFSGSRSYLPIVIDRLRLSKGFSENDIQAEALLPVRLAVEAIVAAKAELDKFIELVRTKARGK